jgi:type IV secretion system protein VirB10
MQGITKSAIGTFILILTIATAGAGQQPGSQITIPQGTRISLQLNDHLSTKLNNEGDTFTATVAVPVSQGDKIVIPKGSIVAGSISRILRPGRFRGKAIMNIVFHSIRMPGKAPTAIVASLSNVEQERSAGVKAEGTIEGEGSKGKDVATVAKPGASGAGIGALVAGGKGAAIGSGIGAAVGLATVFATRGKDLEVKRGSTMDIQLDRPLVIPTEFDSSIVKNR